MKQILQNLATGETVLADVPVPRCGSGELLIETVRSLISIGTEKMLVDFGKAGLLSKARQQPEKVKMVLEKVKTDGLLTTLDAVRSKLDQPLPLGYCNVGVVREVGDAVSGFRIGDRVLSNGCHAEFVAVPMNLCASIPEKVTDDEAAFGVIGSIGLEGIRLAGPTLGETFAVTGLGLIGLLAVQLLRANGCRVLGIDFDETKLALARRFGAETVSLARGDDPVEAGMAFSRGRGVDGVLICASTKSSEPVSQAARMCRKRGRIVLVGVTGLEINRSDFYEKELSFQVSCSYGPGRYDENYEKRGQDYPFGFVRWTEQRNFEAVLDMMEPGKIDTTPLVSHRFAFDDAVSAYDVLSRDKGALGIMLEYGASEGGAEEHVVSLRSESGHLSASGVPVCGFVGAGNYASRILIPAFKKAGARLHTVVSRGGVSASHHGKKAGFARASTDVSTIFQDTAINTVVIATRHNSHAELVIKAMEAGKHVFVEKPLCLTLEELEQIVEVYESSTKGSSSTLNLMVGFNRRFAPLVQEMKQLTDRLQQPRVFVMTMNAGYIPADSWIQDPATGGGRIIGEACHYIDLMRYLAGSRIVDMHAASTGKHPAVEISEDKASITLGFEDGSMGTIHYLANGGKVFPKERIEIFAGDAVLQLDNFRKLKGYGWKGFRNRNLLKQDKGQDACARAFLKSIEKGQPSPIPFDELVEVARISIEAAGELR
jgi:predicted dehydrogenase/threonine dehydrogenase-like Zn-dependent dehydrogenase